MDQRIYLNNVRPLHQTNPPGPKAKGTPPKPDVSFRDVLKKEVDSKDPAIQFSKHAERRLASRNIRLDQSRLTKLSEAVDQAKAKGARESLVLMEQVAYVVSVENRTVITAVDDKSMQDNVFTNIDSAVIVR